MGNAKVAEVLLALIPAIMRRFRFLHELGVMAAITAVIAAAAEQSSSTWRSDF